MPMHARLFSSSRSRHLSKTDLPKILSLDLLWCADILLKVFTCVIARVVLPKKGIYVHPKPIVEPMYSSSALHSNN